MSSIRDWLWLSECRGVSVLRKNALLEAFGGAEEIRACRDERRFAELGLRPEEIRALTDAKRPSGENIERVCSEKNITILTQRDAAYPEKLRNIPDAPIVLYMRGELPPVDDSLTVAVIGSRRPSAYGRVMCANLTDRLCRAGAIIVSGMAMGLDSDAALAALRADRPTVAVLGCGVDVCYPSRSREIYEWIPRQGAILSEYAPGTPPAAANFPARNRIISGLSDGVLILEAARRSGTLITAELAEQQGRDLFAVPGNIDSPNSEGVNRLISDCRAKAVTRPWDVLGEYTGRYPGVDAGEKDRPFRPGFRQNVAPAAAEAEAGKAPASGESGMGMTPEEKAIYECLLQGRRHVDEIIREVGMPASKVLPLLTVMELMGRVKALPGKYYAIAY